MKTKGFILRGFIFFLWTCLSAPAASTSANPNTVLSKDYYARNSLSRRSSTPKIKLTTTIIDEKPVAGDADLRGFELRLKLQFTNEGNKAILLHRSSFDITHIWISESVEKAIKKEFEQSSTQTVITTDNQQVDDLKLKDFVILTKGDVYEVERAIMLFVPYETSEKIPGAISLGSHILQLQAYSSQWNDEDTRNLSQKFGEYGIIWNKAIVSEPMGFCLALK